MPAVKGCCSYVTWKWMYIYVALAEMRIYTYCSLVSGQRDISQDLKLPAGTKTFQDDVRRRRGVAGQSNAPVDEET